MNSLVSLLAQTETTTSGGGAGGFIFAGGFMIIMLVLMVAAFALWLWALIDVLKSSKPSNEKILWVLVICFVQVIGPIIYLFVGRNKSAGMA